MKLFLLYFLLLVSCFITPLAAQVGSGIINCGSSELSFPPEAQLRQDSLNVAARRYQNSNDNGVARTSPPPYVLPIVFHVIHDGGEENLPESDILRSLDYVNQAFANTDYYDQGAGVDTRIQFCLAQRTPDNEPTTGITYHQNALTDVDFSVPGQDEAMKDLARWDPLQYINVYVVRSACGANGCNVIGYAYLPFSHGEGVDGIVVESFLLANDEADVAVLAHELGHYLGLYHTFDGGCNNNDCTVDGDQVCDTPPDQSTVAVPCSGVVNSCDTDTNSGFTTDQNDMFNNYMDYGFRACRNAFTQGQAERMYFFIDGIRSSLLESQGCSPPCNDLVEASFSSNPATTSVPFETNVTFTAQANNATEYAWYISDELVATTSTFTYFFDQAGEVEIRLEVSGTAGCESVVIIRNYSVVCNNPADYTTTTPQIQAGDTVAYVATALVADTYRWILDGTEIGSGPEVIIPFPTVGIVRLCLMTTLNGCTAENCEIVYVAPPATAIGEGCQATTFLSNYPQPGNGELYHGAVTLNSDGSYWQTGVNRDGADGDYVIVQRLSATGEIQLSERLSNFGDQRVSFVPAARELSNGDLLLLVSGSGLSDPGDYIIRFGLATGQEVYRIRLRNSGNGQAVRNLVPIPQQTDRFLVIAKRLPGGNNGSFTVKTVLFDLDATTGAYDQSWRYRAAGPTEKVHALEDGAFWPDGSFRGIGTFEAAQFGFQKRPGISIFSAPNVLGEQFTYHRPSSVEAFLSGIQLIPGNSNWYSTHYGNHLGFINPGGVSSFLNGWNAANEIQWTRRYRPAGTDAFNIMGTVQIGEVLYHSGFLQEENTGIIRLFCFATDNLGNVIWANTYADGLVTQLFVNIGPTGAGAIITDGSRLAIPFTSITDNGSLGLLMINLDGSFDDPCFSPVPLDVFSEDLPTGRDDFSNPDLIVGENKLNESPEPITAGPEIRLNGCEDPCEEDEEICGNGIDDDGNGLTDCDDPAIENDCCCRPLPFVVLPPDTVICPGSGYVLRPVAAVQEALLLWSTNATTDSIIIDQPGTYFVTLTDSCGIMATDSIVITSPALPPAPDLGPDFEVCENGVFTLDAGSEFLRYEWTDLTTESRATFDEPGTYYVRVFNECGDFSADSVTVTIAPETDLQLPDSVGLCSEATVLLSTAGFVSNQWFEDGMLVCTDCPDSLVVAPPLGDTLNLVVVAQNDQGCYGSDTSVIFQEVLEGNFIEASICNEEQYSFGTNTYTVAGEYYADNNCGGEDTLLLTVVFPENEYVLEAVVPRCAGEASGLITVSPPGLGTELSLTSGTFSGIDTLTGLFAGNYQVNVTDFRGCTYVEEITIPENRDFTVLLPSDTLVRLGEEITLRPSLFGLDLSAATFRWEPTVFLNCDTCFSVTARPAEDIIYQVTVVSPAGCEQSAAISLQLDRRERIYVPNAFSPDGDGINDDFFPNCGPEVTEIVDFQVYDRWGGLRYSGRNLTPNDPATGWDGTSGGQLQSPGIFVYRLSARLLDGRIVEIAGEVMLMR